MKQKIKLANLFITFSFLTLALLPVSVLAQTTGSYCMNDSYCASGYYCDTTNEICVPNPNTGGSVTTAPAQTTNNGSGSCSTSQAAAAANTTECANAKGVWNNNSDSCSCAVQTGSGGPSPVSTGIINGSPCNGDASSCQSRYCNPNGYCDNQPSTVSNGAAAPVTQTPGTGTTQIPGAATQSVAPAATAQQSTPVYGDSTGKCPANGSGICSQITHYLCTPESGTAGTLFSCINQIYKFAIVVAAVVGVFFIVIAGYVYMSADGSQESVDKAKDILVSTLTSLVILFIGYVLLAAINPDLVKFNPIQPSNVTLPTPAATTQAPTFGTGTGASCASGSSSVDGFNMSIYATAPTYLSQLCSTLGGLQNLDFSSATNIDSYIQSKFPSSLITGSMVLSASQKNSNIDPKIIVSVMYVDSSMGTAGVGARCTDPGNVSYDAKNFPNASKCQPPANDGVYDAQFPDWQSGVDGVANWLSRHRG